MARRYRKRRLSLVDVTKTLVFLALVIAIVVWLERQNAQTFSGNTWVVDGDTVIINEDKLRLSGIDAPELQQKCCAGGKTWPCGKQAKTALRKLVRAPDFKCTTEGLDRYDRWLVTCTAGGVNVNKALVENGWAIDYGGYGRAEATARQQKNGIWRGDFERPQDWRRINKGDAAALPDDTRNWLETLTSRARGLWRSMAGRKSE